MHQKYSPERIKTIVNQYTKGQAVALLCAEHNVPRSTIYFWIKQYQMLESTTDVNISYLDYHKLKRRVEKLEERLKVIRAAECSLSAPLQEKLKALEKLYGQYTVHALCDALEVSRGTFYNHIFRRRKIKKYDLRREEIRVQVKEVFDESKQRFGARKICAVLEERNIKTSPKYVAGLMQEMGLEAVGRHSKREHKKQGGLTKRQNILQQQFNVLKPNQVWVSDTTCFKVKDKYYYICVIIDLFSRRIVAYRVSPKHSTYLTTSTLRLALRDRDYPQQLTFHSDQGCQYTSKAFYNLLRMNKIVQSFSRTRTPHDNAVAEAFFSALKKEELYRINFKSEREFFACVDNYMDFYNTKRPHGTLAYKTPERFESLFGNKEKKGS